MSELLLGGPLAKRIRSQVAEQVQAFRASGIVPRMIAVLATDDSSAASYAQSKAKGAASLGIQFEIAEIGQPRTQDALLETLGRLATDPTVHGILLESPLAAGLDYSSALDAIPPLKDVDGLTPANLGRITGGAEAGALAAATPLACIELAETFRALGGQRVAVVGRGRTVGRPLVGLLLNRHATPVICHTKTRDLGQVLAACDTVIVAIGRARAITREHLRAGHIVIDAGINVEGASVVGDVDANGLGDDFLAALSPVPGGVGPLTTAIVFRNLMRAIALQSSHGGLSL